MLYLYSICEDTIIGLMSSSDSAYDFRKIRVPSYSHRIPIKDNCFNDGRCPLMFKLERKKCKYKEKL